MIKRDCPCEYCECNMTSFIYMIDPCPECLIDHEEYNDYQTGLGIKENKKWGHCVQIIHTGVCNCQLTNRGKCLEVSTT